MLINIISISLKTFLSIFAFHHSVLVFGNLKYLQFSCPCQKQPLIKITVLYFDRTISGLPGNFLSCNLYLNPFANKNLRISISGFVSLLLIRLILKLLVFLSCTSAITLNFKESHNLFHYIENYHYYISDIVQI